MYLSCVLVHLSIYLYNHYGQYLDAYDVISAQSFHLFKVSVFWFTVCFVTY